jgi:monoamine oxidase
MTPGTARESAAVSDDDVLDVAIVGGGVSGVYSAYRLVTGDLRGAHHLGTLAKARPDGKLRVTVFESSDRIGGRLLSVTPPTLPHVTVELGGMRFLSTHTYVKALVHNLLRLRTRDLPVEEPENLVLLRGQRLRQQSLQQVGQPGGPTLPYQLTWAEQSMDPRELFRYAIDALLPGLTAMDDRQIWTTLEDTLVDGRHVYDYGLWALLNKVLSHEAYALGRAIGGYDCLALNYNAADLAVANFEFVPGTTYAAFVDGFEQVPARLAQMTVDAGGEITRNATLKSVTQGRAGLVRLEFTDGTVVHAHKVILAMPKRSLELLDRVGPLFDAGNAAVSGLIDSVSSIPLFKIFVAYPYPWWEAVGVTQGRSLTDLPIRQCYYWAVEGRQEGADPNDTNAIMLGSYDDMLNTEFWAGFRDLRRQTPFGGIAAATAGSRTATDPQWKDHAAPKAMVDEVHRQLMELHGVKYAPRPSGAVYRDWAEDPFGGAVHLWNIGERSWDLVHKMIQPEPSVEIYVCGEAYSRRQTWVEGALETAEMVLQQKLGLPKPAWVFERP